MKPRRRFKRTTLIMVGLSLFLLGLITVRAFGQTGSAMIGFFVFVSLIMALRRTKRALGITLLLTITFFMGVGRGSAFVDELQGYKDLYKNQVTFHATAREDAVYSDRKQLVFSVSDIELLHPHRKKMIGNIEIEGFGAPMVYKGDRVDITGKMFPKRGDNLASVSFVEITVIKSGQNKVDVFRRRFAAGLQNILPEPLASLGLGILIGQRSTLPEDLTEQLRQVGLIHIVAVSGYNLTIIIYFSQRIFQRRSRFQALVISNVLIILFLLVTGFSPSIVRAAVVSGIGLVMWYYGRNIKPMMILLLAAVITAGVNPLYIWSSIGWYLSFAAFFGVLVLGPLLHKRFVPRKAQSRLLPQILTETIAAQICTVPILLYIFSTLSVVSLLANILVVPLIPFVMLATLIAGIYGMIGPFLLGGVLVIPARIMLGYIVEITRILSTIPYASIEVKVSEVQTALLSSVIVVLTILLTRSVKNKPNSNITIHPKRQSISKTMYN